MVQFLEEIILKQLAVAPPDLETAISKRQCKGFGDQKGKFRVVHARHQPPKIKRCQMTKPPPSNHFLGGCGVVGTGTLGTNGCAVSCCVILAGGLIAVGCGAATNGCAVECCVRVIMRSISALTGTAFTINGSWDACYVPCMTLDFVICLMAVIIFWLFTHRSWFFRFWFSDER